MTAKQVTEHMQSLADEKQAQHLMRFFKTAPGSYGYGDQFLGIKVPETRKIVAQSKCLPLDEIDILLSSSWHEVRLCGLLILVSQFQALCSRRLINSTQAQSQRDEIVEFYLRHTQSANNWDLVDLSVYKILGAWLMVPSGHSQANKLETLDRLASSNNLWEQRMSVVCTLEPLKQGEAYYTLRYAEWHLHHTHDLMHKAVGWMLREMGKRVNIDLLRDFLTKNAHQMPRTTLRYAIEHFGDNERKFWLQK